MFRIYILLFFSFATQFLFSQCPSGTVNLNNQQAVEDYIANFGSCEVINGDLIIGNVTDISGITAIKRIEGSLIIEYQNTRLTSISNFINLEFIGGDFLNLSKGIKSFIGFNKLKTINGNFNITAYYGAVQRIIGFENLTTIGGSFILEAHVLSEIPTFNNLVTIGTYMVIYGTPLTTISGFNNLQFVETLDFQGNDELIEITGFSKLEQLRGDLHIGYNANLTSLQGFENIWELGSLTIIRNPSLTNLSGLENITVINGWQGYALSVYYNLALTDCSAICNLLGNGTLNGIITIEENPSPCSTQTEIEQDCIPDFDKDGIADSDDLDDDNDGILDTVEQNGDVNRDTDGDNKPDHQDLDSDNDGCFDVVESGFTDNDANGTLGDLPDTVDSNGLIIGASDGYTVPLDSDSDGIFDFQLANILSAGEDGSLEICNNSNAIDLFNSLKGTPDTGGVWSPVLLSGTGVFDPAADAGGIYTYTITNGICGSNTSQVAVTVDLLSNAGEDGSLEICFNNNPVDLFDNLRGTPDSGGVWSPVLSSGNGLFDPEVDASGIYTYTVTSGICGSDSSQVAVTVDLMPNAGGDGSLKVCSNNNPVDLFDSLMGTPDSGGVWSPTLSSRSGIFNPSVDAGGIYTYTITNGVCGNQTSEVAVTVDLLPNAGEDGSLKVCSNNNPVDLFDIITGTPDTGGVWSPTLSSGSGIFNPSVDVGGIYTYTITNGVCGSDSSQVNVAIDNLPNAGEDGNLEICINSNSVDLFDSLTGGADAGGTWSPTLSSKSGIFNPSVDASGVYTYTVNNGACGSDTSQVSVQVIFKTPISDYEIKTTEFSNNNSIVINLSSNLEYEFSLDGINYQDNNIFYNLSGGDYNVYVKEKNGCGRLEELVSILDYPKFFTPNNDGFNDTWQLKGRTDKEYSISIYDRYGKLLKNLINAQSGWDGLFNGNPLPSADYWFKIVYADGLIQKGHFTLKR